LNAAFDILAISPDRARLPVDRARQSAIAGAVLGVAVALLGAGVVGVAVHGAAVHAPRGLIALVGLGLMFCGAAFGTVTFRLRLAIALAIPGAALTFLLPTAWFALTPGTRECTVQLFALGHAVVSRPIALGEESCHWVLVVTALLALGVVAGMLFAWRRLGRPPGKDGQ
jgi:hypothetical protein